MTTADIVVLAFVAGWLVGWLLNRKPPVIKNAKIEAKFVIDQTVLDTIAQERVFAWLEARELTWMPKGAVFDPKREVKK